MSSQFGWRNRTEHSFTVGRPALPLGVPTPQCLAAATGFAVMARRATAGSGTGWIFGVRQTQQQALVLADIQSADDSGGRFSDGHATGDVVVGVTMEINQHQVKALRTERGWTQQQLADICALSLRTIQRVEVHGLASHETVNALAGGFSNQPGQPVATGDGSGRASHCQTGRQQRAGLCICCCLAAAC